VKVERSVISNHSELLDKLTVSFVSGTAPDVFTIGSPGIAQFAHPGHVMQLDSVPRMKKEMADFFGPPLNVGTYRGKLFGLTYFVDMRIMLYRKDLLAQAGLPNDRKSLPKNWDQFREVARKLVRWEGGQLTRIGFDVPKGDDDLFLTLVKQLGKDTFSADLKTATFGGAEGEKALQLMVDFLHRDRLDAFERPTMPSGVEPLATGLVAIRWNNSERLAAMKRANVDPASTIVTDLTPEFSGKTTSTGYLGGTWVLANKSTKASDEALDLLTYLSGLEHTMAIAEATTTVPARKSAEKSPLLQDPLLRPFYEALANARSVPQHPHFEQIRVKIREIHRPVLQQQRSVKEGLAEMVAFANTTLAGA
jgi:multiple sugar transport system substrate-binding protein